jgi:hypothetical protein
MLIFYPSGVPGILPRIAQGCYCTALRFSVTISLTYSGILTVSLSVSVGTGAECQAACRIIAVKYFTASSNSFGS